MANRYWDLNRTPAQPWYNCDRLFCMSPNDFPRQCTQFTAHPGNCTVEWEDGIWEVSPDGVFTFEPRLLLIHRLGGPHDVGLIHLTDWDVKATDGPEIDMAYRDIMRGTP